MVLCPQTGVSRKEVQFSPSGVSYSLRPHGLAPPIFTSLSVIPPHPFHLMAIYGPSVSLSRSTITVDQHAQRTQDDAYFTKARQASLSITNSRTLFQLMSIESEIPSNHLILCCPLLLPPSVFPSIRVFSYESALCIRWPKYWSFSVSIGPSNEYSGLISFRIDWLDLLAVQGTLKSLLQHHSSKASILRCSPFFMFHTSYPYITTGKTIALTRQTFVVKVMSLLFNMLSRLVIAFLPRSKCLLISWLQFPSAVILQPKKILLIFIPAILIPACASSSPAFHMIYSAYKLNKQGDNIQP